MFLRYFKNLFRSHQQTAHAEPLLDALEQRLAFYSDSFLANLPSLSAMQNNTNTIVRIQTAQGLIDIELYDRGGPPSGNAAPITTTNFLKYINSGRMDNTYFHRLFAGFVLQGGGYVDDPTTSPEYGNVTEDAAIVNEFSATRSNIAQTIAMAKLGNDPDSATSQWFFNLVDNSSNLNNQNGGFTVFGHVIQGWDVITTIAAFQTKDLTTFLQGQSDEFTDVPLSGPNNSDLVRIIDAEVIKPAGQLDFMTNTIFFPDGYRSGRIVSTVEMTNLDLNATSQYQIIARYEIGTRDTVVSSGVLQPGQHLEVPISKAGVPSLNGVKAGAPFAYEIRTSKPVSAALNHQDFGAAASESFFQPTQFTDQQLESWSFAGGQKGPGIASYLLYENLTSSVNTLTITFYPEGVTPWVITKTIQPYRRGGLNIAQLTQFPDDRFSISITSTNPIVASLSQYRAAPARASIELGVVAGGNVEGILPGAYIASAGQAIISALYTQSAVASIIIDFQFILSDGTVLANNVPFTLSTGVRRRSLDISLANVAIPVNEFFTIRYSVRNAAAPVTLTYFSVTGGGDAIATPFQTASTKDLSFSDGFTDPSAGAAGQETISIFNPYADNATTVSYVLKFHFTDSPSDDIVIPIAGSGSLDGSKRIDISVRSLTDVMARITSDAKFRHYSISLSADFNRGGTAVDGAVFAQLTRLDPAGNTVTTGPTLGAGVPLFFADNADFDAI